MLLSAYLDNSRNWTAFLYILLCRPVIITIMKNAAIVLFKKGKLPLRIPLLPQDYGSDGREYGMSYAESPLPTCHKMKRFTKWNIIMADPLVIPTCLASGSALSKKGIKC